MTSCAKETIVVYRGQQFKFLEKGIPAPFEGVLLEEPLLYGLMERIVLLETEVKGCRESNDLYVKEI